MKALLKYRNYLHHLADALFPPRCISCGNEVDKKGGLCSPCWRGIRFLGEPCCAICSFPFEYEMGDGAICLSCSAQKPVYDRAKSVFIYDDKSRRLVTSFKYADKTAFAGTFSSWMSRVGKGILAESDFIAPVPMHRIRLFMRKYNQSALLANYIGKSENRKVIPDMLKRVKNNAPQASLSKSERLKNVHGAFKLNKKYKEVIAGRNILLIDDVLTTGATVTECAKVLKRSGAGMVFVLTIARTVEGG